MIDDDLDFDELEGDSQPSNSQVKPIEDKSKDYTNLGIVVENEAEQILNMKGKTVEEVLGLAKQGYNTLGSDYSIRHLEIDLETYEDIVYSSQVIQDSITDGMQELEVFDKLSADIFLLSLIHI